MPMNSILDLDSIVVLASFSPNKLDSEALRIRCLLFKLCILIIVDVVSFPSVQTVLADYIKKYVYPGKF